MSYVITVPRKVVTGLDYDGSSLILRAPFSKDSWINELAAGAWDKKAGVWRLPPYVVYGRTVLEQLPDLQVSDAAASFLKASLDIDFLIEAVETCADPRARELYNDVLLNYQREAVDWLVAGPNQAGLEAIFPGGGKTLVTLVAAVLLGLQRVLIIAPRPLLSSWENEQMKFFGEYWTHRRQNASPPDNPLWVLTSYETVVGAFLEGKDGKPDVLRHKRQGQNVRGASRGYFREYMAIDWDLVVLDESVLVKNRDGRRFDVLEKLRKTFQGRKRWWELSGSPVTRYYDDLWAQLHLISPKGFASYWRFTNRTCYVSQDVWGTQVTGSRMNLDILADLADVVFVRSQEDCLPDLPEEIPQLVEVELTPKQRKAHDEMSDDFITRLEDTGVEIKSDIILAQLVRLQQITSNLINVGGTDESAKADALVQLLEARSFAMPALIWTNWVLGASMLLRRLTMVDKSLRIEWIHGVETEADEESNEKVFEQYKAGEVDILILSLPVGKFGHNLQVTRTSIYYDKTWSADDYRQSMLRVKRIGLDHRPVVITLKAPGTVDQLVEDNLSGKFPGIAKITRANLAAMLRHLKGGQT